MDFKKCPRCGNFFHSELTVCQNCLNNENLDIQKLKNYFEENINIQNYTMQDISTYTGISSRNLTRYMVREEFSKYVDNLETEQE